MKAKNFMTKKEDIWKNYFVKEAKNAGGGESNLFVVKENDNFFVEENIWRRKMSPIREGQTDRWMDGPTNG